MTHVSHSIRKYGFAMVSDARADKDALFEAKCRRNRRLGASVQFPVEEDPRVGHLLRDGKAVRYYFDEDLQYHELAPGAQPPAL
jgi:hypothetical protein